MMPIVMAFGMMARLMMMATGIPRWMAIVTMTMPPSNPMATEIYDERDNDCNGCIDDVDDDLDGWTECGKKPASCMTVTMTMTKSIRLNRKSPTTPSIKIVMASTNAIWMEMAFMPIHPLFSWGGVLLLR